MADVMTQDPVTASPELTVQHFIDDYLMRHRFSTIPLVDSAGQLAGLVTLNRIRQVPDGQRAATRLADIACRPADLPVAAAHEPLADLLPRMAGCSDGRAVVLDAQRRLVLASCPRPTWHARSKPLNCACRSLTGPER
jgi:CBS-domain-containing membrane protein